MFHPIYKLQFILKISQTYLTFFQWCWRANWTKSYLKLGERFFSAVTWVLQLHTVWNQKEIGLLILLNCKAASLTAFTTMCHKALVKRARLFAIQHATFVEWKKSWSFDHLVYTCRDMSQNVYVVERGLIEIKNVASTNVVQQYISFVSVART